MSIIEECYFYTGCGSENGKKRLNYKNQSKMSESAVKMRSLTIQEKLEVIEMIENGKSIKDVTEETGINRNSLHYILKNRNKIREEVSKNPVSIISFTII